ncbi:nucleotide-binding domain-containing protein [Ligilactobacillus agilis]
MVDEHNLAKRSRYYHALLANNMLAPGEDYQKLKETYVIFLCGFDPFGLGWAVTDYQMTANHGKHILGDGTHTLILNAKGDWREVNDELKGIFQLVFKGDGQVVVISFRDGVIELVPGFEQSDGNYKYPDSNNGGSWKITKPIPEQEETTNMSDKTNSHYKYLSQLLRKWKNNIGFKFKGLLIDTMVKKFIDADEQREQISFSDYSVLLVDLFEFLSKEDAEKAYWFALGSNQQISNDDNGKFIKKAKKAYNKLKDIGDEAELEKEYRNLFGSDFAKESESLQNKAPNEEFVEKKFIIDIRYNMKLDCTITQNGFRPKRLRDFLAKHWKLKINKTLEFEVVNNDIPSDLLPNVKWYWKVRNVGIEAKKRNKERGQIFIDRKIRREETDFDGNHYVECYAVVDNIVIARDRISVPISKLTGKD